MYVELDKGPQFTEPPCGGANKFCPHQDAGSLEATHQALQGDPDPNDPNAWQEASDGSYMGPAIRMWTSIAKIYANDPAIIYDSWNEGHPLIKTDPQQWQANQSLLIDTIRQQSPKSLVVVYIDQTDMKANLHYHQSNVVIDFHVYPSSYGVHNWPNNINAMVNHIGLGYYEEGSSLYDPNTLQLNALGQALAKDYATAPWVSFDRQA